MKLASLLLVAVTACTSAAHPRPPTTPDALLDAAAGDFHAHSHVTAVRNVRFGRVASEDGTHSLVCGDYREKEGWVRFVTISTSGYEQWLGDGAAHWCDGPHTSWDARDLSSALQARLDRLR